MPRSNPKEKGEKMEMKQYRLRVMNDLGTLTETLGYFTFAEFPPTGLLVPTPHNKWCVDVSNPPFSFIFLSLNNKNQGPLRLQEVSV